MWYSDKYFLNKNSEYENILIELNNLIDQNKRFSDTEEKDISIEGLTLSGKAISFLIGQLLKFYPDLKPMVDGLNRFLFGGGKEHKLSIDLFSQEIRVGFLIKSLIIKLEEEEFNWPENTKMEFLWDYE